MLDLCIFVSWFRRENLFFEENNIMDRGLIFANNSLKLQNVLMMDLFLTIMQLLASEDIMWWTGVVWIIVMFLSAIWTLTLTAPIHCRGSIVEQVMQCYISPNLFQWRNKFVRILNGLRVSTSSANFLFWLNYSFKPHLEVGVSSHTIK